MLLFIRIIGILGAVFFAAGLVVLTVLPKQFERTALGFAKIEIQTEIQARYPGLGEGKTATGLKSLSEKLGTRQDRLQNTIGSDLPDLIAKTIAAYCGCTDQKKIEGRAATIRKGLKARIGKLGIAQNQITQVIHNKYDQIISALKTDLMIFLFTNLTAFAAVFAVSFVRREHRGLVVIPGLLLLIAASAASWLYIAEQDWFYTIIYQDYYGWGYAILMGFIFGLLVDIILNQARVCLNIASNLPAALVPQC